MNKLRKFFTSYEDAINSFNPDLIKAHFVASFMGADPNGITCFSNDEALRAQVLQRRDFYAQLGFKFAEILSVSETPIDEHYTMAKVHWRTVFEKVKGQPQEFKFLMTYFLHGTPDGLRIVFFIAREDEEKVLRDAGLLPMTMTQPGGHQVVLH